MPQSLAKIYLHLVFSTHDRRESIPDSMRDALHCYMATVLSNIGCHAVLISSTKDHVHVLFELSCTHGKQNYESTE